MEEIDFKLLQKYGWHGSYEINRRLYNRMKINADLIKAMQDTKYMVIPTECIEKFVLQESGIKGQLFEVGLKSNTKGDMIFFCDTSPKEEE